MFATLPSVRQSDWALSWVPASAGLFGIGSEAVAVPAVWIETMSAKAVSRLTSQPGALRPIAVNGIGVAVASPKKVSANGETVSM